MGENEQSNGTAVATVDKDKRLSLVAALGMRYGMEAGPFLEDVEKADHGKEEHRIAKGHVRSAQRPFAKPSIRVATVAVQPVW